MYGYLGNAYKAKSQRQYEKQKSEYISKIIAQKIIAENRKKTTPVVGPKNLFYHYIYDLNLDKKEAVKKVLEKYSSLTEDIILKWLEEREEKKEGKNQNNDGR